jgi:AAA15 family ATPase/GTPase
MLKKLSLKGVGPAPAMEVEFAERLTVITGDNGLGKSFILDAVWFALTGKPFGEELRPIGVSDPHIILRYRQEFDYLRLFYNYNQSSWKSTINEIPILNGDYKDKREFFLKYPLLYIGGNGNIGICDPRRLGTGSSYSSIYSNQDLKNGVQENTFNINDIKSAFSKLEYREDRIQINGYIYDFMIWIKDKTEPFNQIERALEILSDNRFIPIKLLRTERIKIGDSREIPIIRMDSGEVPITIASAGVQRIVSFAYAIVWLWQEHKLVAQLTKQPHSRALLLLIDEIETHLHPKWQRKILAAVLEVAKAITDDEGFQVQVICTTHSPIVLTGIEPHFDPAIDKLLDLQLIPGASGERGTVELREVEFEKLGSVGEWLMSDMFNTDDIPEPNADALKKRAALFEQEKPSQAEIDEVDRLMRAHFAPDHLERTHWVWLAKQKGLTLRGQQ